MSIQAGARTHAQHGHASQVFSMQQCYGSVSFSLSCALSIAESFPQWSSDKSNELREQVPRQLSQTKIEQGHGIH
jgi:hypothetical protein